MRSSRLEEGDARSVGRSFDCQGRESEPALPEIPAPPTGGPAASAQTTPGDALSRRRWVRGPGSSSDAIAKSVVGTVRDRSFRPMQIDDIMNPSSPKPAATLVGDLFIDHDDVVEEAFALMSENHVTSLPVLGPGGEVVGSVSYSEILRRLPEARQRVLGHAR